MLDVVITYLIMLHSKPVSTWFKVLYSHLTGKPCKDHTKKFNWTKSLQVEITARNSEFDEQLLPT